jgi:tetratricopeptide (TPR) repeat protein
MYMKKRRIQVVVTVLLLALAGGCHRSPEARRDRYLARGKEYLAKADYGRAVVEFRNAAQAMPKDPEPYYQLGLGFLGLNDYRSALTAFRKTLELNPKHVGAQLKIAQMKVESENPGLLKEAEGQLNAILSQNPANADAMDTLAVAQLRLSQGESAIQTLDRALAQTPGNLVASLLLARQKVAEDDAKGAEEVLKAACKNVPKSADARRLLGEFYITQKKLPEAETELRQAVAIESRNGLALLDLARVELTEGRKQEAEQTFKRLTTFDTYKPLYGTFLVYEGRRDDAIREFERLVKENPDNRQLRTDLIAVYRIMNRTSDIDKLLDAALRKNPKDVDALLERAQVLLDRRDYARAENDLNYVLHLQPNSPEAHYRMAKLHQARSDFRSYRDQLSETLRLNPALESVRIELAQSLIADKAPKDALAVLDAAPESQKDSTAILVARNWTLWFLGDMERMRKGIDQGLSKQPSAAFLVQDAAWNLREKHVEPARAALEKALNADPANIQALSLLAQSYRLDGKAPLAVQKVREYAARAPNSAPVQILFGDLLLAQHQLPEARAAFLKAKAADPRFVKADLSLADVDILEGKIEDASKRLQGIIATDNGNVAARMLLGHVDEIRGDKSAAIAQYRKVLEIDAENALALNNLAYLLADYANQPDAALPYAQKAVELSPDAPDYCDTLGWIFYRKTLYPQAVQYLERAASHKDGNVVWRYHLAMAYAKAGKLAQGQAILSAALKENPHVPEAVAARQILLAH